MPPADGRPMLRGRVSVRRRTPSGNAPRCHSASKRPNRDAKCTCCEACWAQVMQYASFRQLITRVQGWQEKVGKAAVHTHQNLNDDRLIQLAIREHLSLR